MNNVSYTRAVDILLLLSNLFILIPAYRAYKWNRYTRAILFFTETWASFFYHACDSFNVCLGLPFSMWHVLDFLFATWMIWQAGLYIIDFKPRWLFLERWLFWLGGLFIGIFIAAFPQSQVPILAKAGFAFLIVALYWLFYAWYAVGKGKYYKLPKYNWDYFLIGVMMLSFSTMLFTVQNTWPMGYWGIHSLWHMMAGLGMDWLIQIKEPAQWWQTADASIQQRIIAPVPVLTLHKKQSQFTRKRH